MKVQLKYIKRSFISTVDLSGVHTILNPHYFNFKRNLKIFDCFIECILIIYYQIFTQ